MIYFTAYETLRASLAMLAFGAGFFVFEVAFINTSKAFKYGFAFFKLAYNHNVKFSEIDIKFKADIKNKALLFVLDFFIVVCFFAFFILLSYAFYDGILRIYFFVMAYLSYLFSKKLLKKIDALFGKFTSASLTLVFFALSIALIPLKATLKILIATAKIIYLPIDNRIKSTRSEKILRIKRQEIRRFLQIT